MESTGTRLPLHKLAIAAGVIIGFVGSLVTLFAVIMTAAVVAGVQGGAADPPGIERWFQEPVSLLAFQVVSVLWLVAGAFGAAKLAGRDHVRHGAWTGGGAFVLYIVSLALPSSGETPIPWWSHAVGFVVTIPASLLGGYLAKPR